MEKSGHLIMMHMGPDMQVTRVKLNESDTRKKAAIDKA